MSVVVNNNRDYPAEPSGGKVYHVNRDDASPDQVHYVVDNEHDDFTTDFSKKIAHLLV
jgi:hypothetical protein